MKLIGSNKEREIRDRLIKGRQGILNSNVLEPLRDELTKNNYDVKSILILKHVPDQDADYFTLLVDRDKIIKVEVSKFDTGENVIDVLDVNEYLKNCSKTNRLVFIVAKNLAERSYK